MAQAGNGILPLNDRPLNDRTPRKGDIYSLGSRSAAIYERLGPLPRLSTMYRVSVDYDVGIHTMEL